MLTDSWLQEPVLWKLDGMHISESSSSAIDV